MSNIVAFLTARLDEDQAGAEAAQAVDPGPWTVQPVSPTYPHKVAEAGNRSGHGAAVVVAADGTELWDTYDSDYGDDQHSMAAPTARHIARHDSARVLADVAAKRAILAEIASWRHDYVDGDTWYSCAQAVEPERARSRARLRLFERTTRRRPLRLRSRPPPSSAAPPARQVIRRPPGLRRELAAIAARATTPRRATAAGRLRLPEDGDHAAAGVASAV